MSRPRKWTPRDRRYNSVYKKFRRAGRSRAEAAKAALEAAGPPLAKEQKRCPTCGAFTRRIVATGEPDDSPVD